MAGASLFSRFAGGGGAAALVLALVLAACCATPASAQHRQTFYIGWPTTWTAPVGAVNMTVSVWGGGGGASGTSRCAAGGGSGSAVINRAVGDLAWGIPATQVRWSVQIGAGGAGYSDPPRIDVTYGQAGNGGMSTIVAKAPNGTELFRATAYGGGGALTMWYSRTQCWGGAGGGANSSAVGAVPGSGIPSGGVDNNGTGLPTEGAMIGDIKAGGAGAGFGFFNGDLHDPVLHGAPWTSPGQHWDGGWGYAYQDPDYGFGFARGGAAGFGGVGGGSQTEDQIREPPANSGSGGGSRVTYADQGYQKFYSAAGASGGATLDYALRMPPVLTFKSSASNKYLTAHSYSGVSANATVAQTWEKWFAIPLADGKYAFRSWQAKYLKANPTNSVEATATVVSTWEQFTPVDVNHALARWAFKTHHGTYLSAAPDGFVFCGTDPAHYWTISDLV
ncbi:fascin-like protein [Pandoravirus japonicus]|uniref:Fascin-like protein n=1 Tax=Pandoravirus japonicus TaxID=2823154 RepID=A0A811BS54_9VIRU|nr:fascin-like protein [Pandoravirus japonicus]